MSIPTVPVTVRLFDQDGNPVAGATVTAKLTTTERYGGYVVPKEYRGETDANGVAVVNVFPNELGTEGSEYKFKIVDMATGKTVSVYATVPNAPCELHQISELEPYLFKHSSSVVPVANGGTGRSDGVFKVGDSVGAFVAGPSSGSDADVRSVAYLAQYRKRAPSITGAIVFRAPTNASAIMQQFIISGLIHNLGIVKTLVQGNRVLGATSFITLYKVSLGSVDVPVRLGTDADGKTCIVLGDAGSMWSYPYFTITNALFGHTGATDDYCNGWTAGIVTDLSGYTLSSTIPSAPVTADIAGNAATATLAAAASDMAAGHVLAGKTTAEAVRSAIAAPSPNVGKYMITYSRGTGAQGLAAGTWTDVLQGTSSPYGDLGATDPGTGVLALRVPESGTYMIKTCALVVASTMGYAVAGIALNGTIIIERGFGLVRDGTWVQIICSFPIWLEANDVVSVKVWCSVAANIPATDSFIELVRIR